VRTRLAAENPQAAIALEGVLSEVVGGIRTETRKVSRDFANARTSVEARHRNGKLGEAEVHGFARERRFEETVVALSLLCGVEIDVVERALLDPGHEIMLILSKLAGFSSTTAKALLLFKAADRGMSAQDLERALQAYGRLQADTAQRVIRFYRARLKRPAGPSSVTANA
jgi:hypothetical protein